MSDWTYQSTIGYWKSILMEIQLEEEMKTYEILIAGKWERVKGKTQGLREGWLEWKDSEGCNGLSKPGSWREVTKKEKKD